MWSNRARDAALPAVAPALAAHWGYRQQRVDYLRTYYYQHVGLLLWHRTFGTAYTALRYFWRMEPDVLYTGSLGAMLAAASRDTTSDALLPPASSQKRSPHYGCHRAQLRPDEVWEEKLDAPSGRCDTCVTHWTLNWPLVSSIPPEHRSCSLVLVGRF